MIFKIYGPVPGQTRPGSDTNFNKPIAHSAFLRHFVPNLNLHLLSFFSGTPLLIPSSEIVSEDCKIYGIPLKNHLVFMLSSFKAIILPQPQV
ncbi:hypothetical protein HN51_060557 [Arachis hypogaea]